MVINKDEEMKTPFRADGRTLTRVLTRSAVWSLILLMLAPLCLLAQSVQVVQDGATFEVQYTTAVTESALVFGRAQGYDTVSLIDGGYLAEPGKPQVPAQTVALALPAGMTVTGVRLVAAETVDLPGEYSLLPAQPPRRLSDPPAAIDFVPPDAAIYSSSAPYPSLTVDFVQQTDLAGQALAILRLYPVHYLPADRKLTLCTSITLSLDGVTGYRCGDYLPRNISKTARASCRQVLARMASNPADVELRTAGPETAGPRGVSPGDYDYVIITTSDWTAAFQPLADWKTKKGVPANIVTTTWIYSNYSGSTNVDKIRAFVQDAYANWGTTFFLIGGDTDYVPCHMRTFSDVDSDPVPNDTYYADFDSDWLCEVHVGRASVTGTGSGAGGIANFISKLITYEKNPPTTNYAKKAAFFGFDLDASTPAEQCKIFIKDNYLPSSWTLTTVYDSATGNHRTNVIAAVNAGQMLINHADHSNDSSMGVGYVNHNLLLSSSDMDGLNNGTRQGVLYSMGCDPAAFDHSNCIAEHFVRDTNGGGVAFIGNSRYGWYDTASYDSYSMLYDRYFFHSLFTNNCYRLGTAFSDHKNTSYPPDSYYQYIFTELTLLGDPEMPVWTDTFQTLAVAHPTIAYVGAPATFTVQVNSGGSPVSAATVCLWKAGDLYQVAQTNGSGAAGFTIAPASAGTLSVTVAKQNCLPYEGSAAVQAPVYTLTTNVAGQGTVSLNPPGGSYSAGVSVQLTAQAAGGRRFNRWFGDLTGTANPATIIMNGNKTVTANFVVVADLNCDGDINGLDIKAFVSAILDQSAYASQYPDCNRNLADINNDGAVNTGDIGPLVTAVMGG